MLALLLPLMLPGLILVTAFYSLEEGGTNQHNMVPHPIIWNFGQMVQAHHFAHNMQEVQVAESSTTKGVEQPSSQKAFACWC